MKFESNASLCKDNSENEEYVFNDTEDGTIEPSIDYNDKQVRFSSIVLDTKEDIFKPLKEETILLFNAISAIFHDVTKNCKFYKPANCIFLTKLPKQGCMRYS